MEIKIGEPYDPLEREYQRGYTEGRKAGLMEAVEMREKVKLTPLPYSLASHRWTDAMAEVTACTLVDTAYRMACNDYADAIEAAAKEEK